MGTEVLKSFGTLQSELEQAKSSLKGVDENIKRLIGRDPSDLPSRAVVVKRAPPTEEHRRPRPTGRSRIYSHENDEPPNKRRGPLSVFQRLSDKVYDDEPPQPQRQMISKVIVTPKELPSRQEALEAQSKDERSKARNRRMFGALLGTLQKFQQEETKLKQKEDKRARLEKKIEEHEIKEKEEIKKERQELFLNRKRKQAEIKMIELKMIRMEEYAAWEERQKPRMNFIQTKAKPHIHYLPRKMTEATSALLETCRADIEKMIDTKRQEVYDELQHIEHRTKKNFDTTKKQHKSQKSTEEPNKTAEEQNGGGVNTEPPNETLETSATDNLVGVGVEEETSEVNSIEHQVAEEATNDTQNEPVVEDIGDKDSVTNTSVEKMDVDVCL